MSSAAAALLLHALMAPMALALHTANDSKSPAATALSSQPGLDQPSCDNYKRAQGSAPAKYLPHLRQFVVQDSDGSNAHWMFGITGGAAAGPSLPVAGNWDGAGDAWQGVGVYDVRTSSFMLRNSLTSGPADHTLQFGAPDPTARPIAGDWDGSGQDSVGLYFGSTGMVLLRLGVGSRAANITFPFGPAGNSWWPIAGDWTGDGKASVGLYDPVKSTFYLRNTTSAGPADITIQYGAPNLDSMPVAGRWAGSPFQFDSIGIVQPGPFFELKYALAGGGADLGYTMSVSAYASCQDVRHSTKQIALKQRVVLIEPVNGI
jgi:hypothetical protein